LSAIPKLPAVCSQKFSKMNRTPSAPFHRTNLTLPLLIRSRGFFSSLSCLTFQNVRQSVQHSLSQAETTMAQRHQRGWLKKEKRAQGETWVLFFRTTRKSDGKRVENKIPIGLVQHLPEASSAWAEVERLHVPINRVDVRRGLIFGDLAQHYAEHELAEASESIRPKAHTTIKGYERVLRNRLLPRWGNRIALGIEPLEGGIS
jgi:hypothetical protein